LGDGGLAAYDVPDVALDRTIAEVPPPQDTDKHVSLPTPHSLTNLTTPSLPRYYLATDERDPQNVTYLTVHGAVLVGDLLTIDDRRAFGWSLMLTDVLGLVEQAVLSHAYFFYAHSMSSYAGGIMNMRAAAGMDPRMALVD
jgi:hypothetical protein